MSRARSSFRNYKTITGIILSLLFCGNCLETYAVTLSYGITVSTESEQLNRLLNQLSPTLENNDSIFIQVDKSNTTRRVKKVIKNFKKIIPSSQLHIIYASLNGDFGSFKNNLLNNARKKGCKHLFLIDADEYLSDFLLKNIKWFISQNRDIDLIKVPRANYYIGDLELGYPNMAIAVSEGLDDQGRFLYPDAQSRIVDLKNANIRFTGKLHETITGHKKSITLPYDNKSNHWDIIHIKTPQDQVKGNKLYAAIAEKTES